MDYKEMADEGLEKRFIAACKTAREKELRDAAELKAFKAHGHTPEEFARLMDIFQAAYNDQAELMAYRKAASLEQVQAWAKEYEDGWMLTMPDDMPQDITDVKEPLKMFAALRSELMKFELRQKTNPESINILDYTIIAVLRDACQAAMEKEGKG